ncbi:flagella synthesis protein FlgN [Marinobacter segnicrescens]|uniref:Flagella synthesis protein FlgN n=1 Tax=Marinobacter segnicrescens TaxID=430453 RepID=A0A1H9YBJ0_9GAMM|nr:flagellar protein FlgN [Marinobacter segnicrescens]SES65787.1 flagella synthesis protein FlgN [Marinobacter segnicrescens]
MSTTDKLQALLNQDLEQLRQLETLLEEEQALLGDADVRAIEPVTSRKNALLGDIRERARQKVHLLVEMGFRPDQGHPSRFIRSAGLTELYQSWEAAQSVLARCHSLNQQNSKVVAHLQSRLSRLTDIFRGSSGQQKLYGATGQQTSVGQRNILASA